MAELDNMTLAEYAAAMAHIDEIHAAEWQRKSNPPPSRPISDEEHLESLRQHEMLVCGHN